MRLLGCGNILLFSYWAVASNLDEITIFNFLVFQDEEAAESRQAKLFISTHNRQSEECAQLIKSILAGMKLTIRRRSVITISHFNLVCLKDLSAYKLSKP